jgi:hypothetical protein
VELALLGRRRLRPTCPAGTDHIVRIRKQLRLRTGPAGMARSLASRTCPSAGHLPIWSRRHRSKRRRSPTSRTRNHPPRRRHHRQRRTTRWGWRRVVCTFGYWS